MHRRGPEGFTVYLHFYILVVNESGTMSREDGVATSNARDYPAPRNCRLMVKMLTVQMRIAPT